MRGDRLANCKNSWQGKYKRVLCVCSMGLLRSPTAALVLSRRPFNYNTRAAGLDPNFSLIVVDEALLTWAQEIVCMDQYQVEELGYMLSALQLRPKIVVLGIKDSYRYRDPELIALIKDAYLAGGV